MILFLHLIPASQVWLARWPGITPTEKTADWEEGLYQFFDPALWRRVPHHFRYLVLDSWTSIVMLVLNYSSPRLTYSELAEKTAVSLEDLNPTPK